MFRSNVRHITTFKFTYYEKEKTNIKRNVGNDKRFSNKTNANSKTTFRLDAIRYDTTYTGWLYGNLDKYIFLNCSKDEKECAKIYQLSLLNIDKFNNKPSQYRLFLKSLL